MASVNCVTRSITMTAGESYVLPPGAVLIGASDPGSIDSNCELPELETPACYVAIIGASVDDPGIQQYFEASNSKVVSIKYNNVFYDLPVVHQANFVGVFPTLPAMVADIASTLLVAGGVTFSGGTGTFTNPGNGVLTFIALKTLPSIANNLFIRVRGTMRTVLTPEQSDLDLLSPFYPRQTWIDAGYTGVATCP